jgi:uncharacterized membrane protein
MAPNNLQKKPDNTRCSVALFVIACILISIGALTILIDLMWLAAIFLAIGAGYYRLRAQTLDLNRLTYRLRLFIYRLL